MKKLLSWLALVACLMGAVVRGETRWRGAMVDPNSLTPAGLGVLGGAWHANLVRWQFVMDHATASSWDEATYRRWFKDQLALLDARLPDCAKNGLKVVIDMHVSPGGLDGNGHSRVLNTPWATQAFVDLWTDIARRYAGNTTIWGYDLLNEPRTGYLKSGYQAWQDLAAKTARRIRRFDATHPIIIESPYADPSRLRNMRPLSVPGCVYSVHMYHPGDFTHQGLFEHPLGVRYESAKDKGRVKRVLDLVTAFQKRHRVPIYVGEFSAVRWAPLEDAHDYLRDCIQYFERRGWNWTYHAFREADCWSVEIGGDRNSTSPSPTPTLRQQLLQRYFDLNPR